MLRRGLLPHRRFSSPRPRWLLHLCWARRRRVQELRLSAEPLRARERSDRIPLRRRSGGCASSEAIRWDVPKAFITLKPGFQPSGDLARQIFQFVRSRLSPYKRIRRIEFSELPKTISGKIRRVHLRGIETPSRQGRRPGEYWEDDFPDL